MRNKNWILITTVSVILISGISVLILRLHPLSKEESIAQMIEILPKDFKRALLSMYDGQDQMGIDGNMYKIDLSTKITPEQGMCIYYLCQRIQPQKTLEIGFAYGFSTLYFLASIESNKGGSHTAIDPFEKGYWHGIGLKKVEELRMDSSFQLIADYDMFGLPELARNNQSFDVIFIDGDHRFDYVLTDFTFCDHMLSDNGFIIFHDTGMPAIKKVTRYIMKNRSDYQVYEDIPSPQMLIFKKISDDNREWNHFRSF